MSTTYDIDGGPIYTEGAMAQVVLRDGDGRRVASKTFVPGRTVVFRGLEAGMYTLKPALRPCDANCGYLDPPTDACAMKLTITADLHMQVGFATGKRCVISAVGD